MTQPPSSRARWAAALVAASAWIGIAVQFDASLRTVGSIAGTAWTMALFFTVIANLATAILFTGIAWGKESYAQPVVTGGATVIMLLVGITYALLLRGLIELSGGAKLADFLLHSVTPVLVPLFWLAFAPKGLLRWRDPWLWAAAPLLYLPYALARGAIGGRYAYPFIDVARIGGAQVALNALGLAVAFVGASFALVALDHELGRRLRAR